MAIDATPTAAQTAADLKALIAAERAGEPFLHARAIDGGQQIFVLSDGSWRTTIGRHDECDSSNQTFPFVGGFSFAPRTSGEYPPWGFHITPPAS